MGKTKTMRFRKGGNKKEGLVMEGESDRGGEEIQIFGVRVSEERKTESTGEG